MWVNGGWMLTSGMTIWWIYNVLPKPQTHWETQFLERNQANDRAAFCTSSDLRARHAHTQDRSNGSPASVTVTANHGRASWPSSLTCALAQWPQTMFIHDTHFNGRLKQLTTRPYRSAFTSKINLRNNISVCIYPPLIILDIELAPVSHNILYIGLFLWSAIYIYCIYTIAYITISLIILVKYYYS